jgi:hypothetical protein
MTSIETHLASEYGIMFLHDSTSAPVFPVDVGEEPVTSTSTCLAFSVLSYVDGDAKIILCGTSLEGVGEIFFEGKLQCPSKSISLCDHNGFAYASLPLQDSVAQVSLFMSEARNPETVQCVIKNIESF